MGLSVNTNVASLNAQRNLYGTEQALSRSLQRLSSGLRINSAKDDAAGLGISDRMTSQIRGLDQAIRNANDGISLSQTAEGALQEITTALQRIRELGVQSANDTNSVSDRASLQAEVIQLQAEITRISEQTEFNGTNILDGSFLNAKFHIGMRADQTINVSIGNTKANNIGAYQVAGPAAAADNTGGGETRVEADTFTVSGYKGSTTVSVADNDSAETVAASVNNVTGDTGVTATAKTEITLSAFDITTGANGSTFNFDLTGDGTATIVGTLSGTTGTDLDAFVQAVNDHAATTGVMASRDGDTVVLTSQTGDNIQLENNQTADATGFQVDVGTAANFGALAADDFCVAGTVTLESEKTFGVSDATAGEVFTNAIETATLSKVSDIDISDQSGSNDALSVIDKAIALIDSIRGDLGAIQNRFESTIANLQTVSENISAARSRVMDADFAAETANLTRAQIMQQAGVAMLAQANMLPQTVLSLLQ